MRRASQCAGGMLEAEGGDAPGELRGRVMAFAWRGGSVILLIVFCFRDSLRLNRV